MKIRFVLMGQGICEGMEHLIAEVDVTKKPSKEEMDAVYYYINRRVEKWEESDMETHFDYEKVCRAACRKYLQTSRNPVVATYYL